MSLAGVAGWRALASEASNARRAPKGRFGPLRPDPDGVLDLPEGFRYRVLDRRGAPMDDGHLGPALPDGMGCFPTADGKLALMRNHELPGMAGSGYVDAPPTVAYSADHAGGVTRLVVDPDGFERMSSNLVLTGTSRNCAGGHSPWGWLSCEETTEPSHGYVFLCDAEASTVQRPRRIDAYGRFQHEAAVVDPESLVAYLTEDVGTAAFYRFVPASPSTPFDGVLQALRVRGKPRFDTARAMHVGERLDVEWVDIPDPTPANGATYAQALARDAAVFSRCEGIDLADGAVTFCSTTGGPAGAGQVFRLEPEGDGGTLQLVAQSLDTATLHCPDNVSVAPWGEVYLAEDPFGRPFVRGITEGGEVFDFARNALSWGEIAGICFSPDGRAMFASLQHDGLTVVITGPFPAVG